MNAIGAEMVYQRRPLADVMREQNQELKLREYEFFRDARLELFYEWEALRPKIHELFATNPNLRGRFEAQLAIVRNWMGDPSTSHEPIAMRARQFLFGWRKLAKLEESRRSKKGHLPVSPHSGGAASSNKSVVDLWNVLAPRIRVAFAAEPYLVELFEMNRAAVARWESQNQTWMRPWWVANALHWELLLSMNCPGASSVG